MGKKNKRLDLQFGSFACSVQGFDDPVLPVQQVLQALQNLLEEMPELADATISFNADAIDRLMGEVARRADIDEENVEIVPGLIIVHRSDAVADRRAAEPDAADHEAWSRPFVAGDASDASDASDDAEPEEAREEEPQFVNIFATSAGSDEGDAATPLEAADVEEEGDGLFGARLEGIDEAEEADEPSTGDIFADAGDTGNGVFANPMGDFADEAEEEDEIPLNLFAANRDEDVGASRIPDAADGANLFAETGREEEAEERESARIESLFGDFGDQAEAETDESEEGYTAATLAKRVGAETVPELMVSAAAWMVLLQGQTSFTRKDVIKVFEGIPGDHPDTLEARIKGFGKAVRNGQLIMIEDGVFGLSRAELERFQSVL